jgi:hypothetical protein
MSIGSCSWAPSQQNTLAEYWKCCGRLCLLLSESLKVLLMWSTIYKANAPLYSARMSKRLNCAVPSHSTSVVPYSNRCFNCLVSFRIWRSWLWRRGWRIWRALLNWECSRLASLVIQRELRIKDSLLLNGEVSEGFIWAFVFRFGFERRVERSVRL